MACLVALLVRLIRRQPSLLNNCVLQRFDGSNQLRALCRQHRHLSPHSQQLGQQLCRRARVAVGAVDGGELTRQARGRLHVAVSAQCAQLIRLCVDQVNQLLRTQLLQPPHLSQALRAEEQSAACTARQQQQQC